MAHLNTDLAKAVFGKDGTEKYKEYEEALTVKEAVDRIRSRMATMVEEHEKFIAEMNTQVNGWRKRCKHQLTRYHADAAGGSDSWTECLICGGNVK